MAWGHRRWGVLTGEAGKGRRGQEHWHACKGLALPHGSNEPHASATLKPISSRFPLWRLTVGTDKRAHPAQMSSQTPHCTWPLPGSRSSHQHAQPGLSKPPQGQKRPPGAAPPTLKEAGTSTVYTPVIWVGQGSLERQRAIMSHGGNPHKKSWT
jgi:hypothetical protein